MQHPLPCPTSGRGIYRTLIAVALGASVAAQGREPWVTGRVTGSPNPPAPYDVVRVHPAQRFENPVDLAFMPGSTRLFVAEQAGRIWSFDTAIPGDKPALAIDLRQHHTPFDNILGFTFHPGFATNHQVFINYNEPGGSPLGAHVSRFTLGPAAATTLDPASEREILRWPGGGHNGCTLAFGNDGFLYISTGDSADPDPPDGKAKTGQDISDLLSSVLRIDVSVPDGESKPYRVPADNPFRSIPGARPEVWAFGFRNPFRMSFDPPTGDLWLGDVGWEQWEMIIRVRRGGNYGWSLVEGPNTHVRTDVAQGPGPILPPMVALPHSEAASITGGRVYRGNRLPKLAGAYLYGDWETGKFWALRHNGDTLLSNEELCDTTLKPTAFAADPQGELLILDYAGGLYAFAPSSAPPANQSFPRRLSETGIFTDLATLSPAPGVVATRPAAEMWSDGARVERHLAVPERGVVRTGRGRQTIVGTMWSFPTNTVMTRTLTLEGGGARRRVETQLLHFEGQGWNAYTFRWNEAQTDAELVPAGGTNATVALPDPMTPGGVRPVSWRFSGRSECLRCHNSWAADLLSFNWLQLAPGERQRLAAEGVLEVIDPPARDQWLVNPHDPAAPLQDRARSWLHVNCAGCHRFGAGGGAALHLNFDKPLAELRAVNVRPTRGDFGLAGGRIIAPGHPFSSALLYRITTEGSGHMPHIGSRVTDEAGVRLVTGWIRSLPRAEGDLEAESAGARVDAALRGADIPGLLGSMNGALALAGSLRAAEVAAPPLPALAHTNALVRDLFQRFLPPAQRRQTLGSDIQPSTILSIRGDPDRGKGVFSGAAQCSRCHVCEGEGRAFGPELSGVGRKYPPAQLLDQILNPSKVIAQGYQTRNLSLADGTELSGFVISRTEGSLVLRDETLTDHVIPLKQIESLRDSALSVMPEGLLAPLTPQEAADLLAFLERSAPAR